MFIETVATSPPSVRESVGKTTLRALGELCGSAVIDLSQEFHRRDAEHAELTLRKTIIPTDSLTPGVTGPPPNTQATIRNSLRRLRLTPLSDRPSHGFKVLRSPTTSIQKITPYRCEASIDCHSQDPAAPQP